jgi:hypothetical protein
MNASLIEARRLAEASVDGHYATGDAVPITNALLPTFMPMNSTFLLGSEEVPDQECHLWWAGIFLDQKLGLGGSVEWSLSVAGTSPVYRLTPIRTTMIDLDDPTWNWTGMVTAQIDFPYRRPTGIGTAGTLYCAARLTGIAQAIAQPFVMFRAKVPYPVYPLN